VIIYLNNSNRLALVMEIQYVSFEDGTEVLNIAWLSLALEMVLLNRAGYVEWSDE
jgi:hypothetical protein